METDYHLGNDKKWGKEKIKLIPEDPCPDVKEMEISYHLCSDNKEDNTKESVRIVRKNVNRHKNEEA